MNEKTYEMAKEAGFFDCGFEDDLSFTHAGYDSYFYIDIEKQLEKFEQLVREDELRSRMRNFLLAGCHYHNHPRNNK